MTNYDDYFGGLTREEYEEETKEHFKHIQNMQKTYKWKIDIILKSGKELTVYYVGNENSSSEVANIVINGNDDTFNGFNNIDKSTNILVKVGEIAAMSISLA